MFIWVRSVRKWIARRQHFGASDILLKELASKDPDLFQKPFKNVIRAF